MIICFTGHRDCIVSEYDLFRLHLDHPNAKWIHGGAKSGFDKQVQDFINSLTEGIEFEVFPPEYDKYSPKVAPIMRNHKMIDMKPDLLVALWDGTKTGGTYDTIEYAKSKGIEIKYLDIVKHIKLPKRQTIVT